MTTTRQTCDHIVATYHAPLWPLLARLPRSELAAELAQHMRTEEAHAFPILSGGGELPPALLAKLEADHGQAIAKADDEISRADDHDRALLLLVKANLRPHIALECGLFTGGQPCDHCQGK